MATIIDDGSNIKLTSPAGDVIYIPKAGFSMKEVPDTTVALEFYSYGAKVMTLAHSQVTNPVNVSREDLMTQIDVFLESGGTPLPAGAATSAKQDEQTTELQAIKTAVQLLDDTVAGTELQVDVITSALPTGAATEIKQDSIVTELQAIKANTDSLEVNTDELESRIGEVSATPTANTLQDRLKTIKEDLALIEAKDFATETTLAAIKTAVELLDNAIAGAEMQVDVVTSALPTGASTAAKQDTIIANTNKPTTIADGRKIVAVAGTRETLVAAPTTAKRVSITAETDNTGIVVVGGTTVVAAVATRRGTPLNAGDSYEFEIDDLQKVNIDSTVTGDGVTFTYFN